MTNDGVSHISVRYYNYDNFNDAREGEVQFSQTVTTWPTHMANEFAFKQS